MNTRQREIVEAVKDLIAEHETWARDNQLGDVPSEAIEIRVRRAVAIVKTGDWPQATIQLCQAIESLGDEWARYAGGQYRADGTPMPTLWKAMAAVIEQFKGTQKPTINKIEPVHILLDQFAQDAQRFFYVARAYGWKVEDKYTKKSRWEGPFFTENEVPDVQKIVDQADWEKSDGKKGVQIIPDEWVCPSEEQRVREEMDRLARTLEPLEQAAESKAFEDPATVEELLREGQFPDVIAKVKHVEVDEVRRIAADLGIIPNERDMQAPAFTVVSEVDPETDPTTPESDEPEQPEDPGPTAEELRDAVIETADENQGYDSGQIAKAVHAEYGFELTPRQVAAYLRHRTITDAAANG